MGKEKKHCVYCGDAQVNHTIEYVSNFMTLMMNTIIPRFPQKIDLFFSRMMMPIITTMERLFVSILSFTHIITFSTEKTLTHRTSAILTEAKRRNIPMQVILIFGKLLEYSRIKFPDKKKWLYFESLPIAQYIENSVSIWVDNKSTFNKKCIQNNVPVVRSTLAWTEKGALNAFDSLTKPVITKPQYGSRARHTTVDITDKKEFIQAFKRARQLCPSVVIEEFKRGTLYRATVIGKKVIGIIEFVKPTVIADGVLTVHELLIYHNTHKKYPHLTDVKDDAWFIDAITHQGLTKESIPEKGRIVQLSEHSERPNGGYFIDITDEVPLENIAIIERAARVTNLDVIGFDIISLDLKKPFSTEPFVFIEGNSLPFIELHLEVYEGKKRDTPKAIFDLWEKR